VSNSEDPDGFELIPLHQPKDLHTKRLRLASDFFSILASIALALLFAAYFFPPLFMVAMGLLVFSGAAGFWNSWARLNVLQGLKDDEKPNKTSELWRHRLKIIFGELVCIGLGAAFIALGMTYNAATIWAFMPSIILLVSGVLTVISVITIAWNGWKLWQATKEYQNALNHLCANHPDTQKLLHHVNERRTKLILSALILLGSLFCLVLAFTPFTAPLLLAGIIASTITAAFMAYYWRKNLIHLELKKLNMVESLADYAKGLAEKKIVKEKNDLTHTANKVKELINRLKNNTYPEIKWWQPIAKWQARRADFQELAQQKILLSQHIRTVLIAYVGSLEKSDKVMKGSPVSRVRDNLNQAIANINNFAQRNPGIRPWRLMKHVQHWQLSRALAKATIDLEIEIGLVNAELPIEQKIAEGSSTQNVSTSPAAVSSTATSRPATPSRSLHDSRSGSLTPSDTRSSSLIPESEGNTESPRKKSSSFSS